MAAFSYIATTKTGNKIEGRKEAGSRDELIDYLISQGLSVITVQEDFSVKFQKLLRMELTGFSMAERVVVIKQLSTMISAGVPIIQAINILRTQSQKESMKEVLDKIYHSIEGGSSLSDSIEKSKGLFSEVQVNLIRAGEKSGNLSEMLGQVAIDMEKSKTLKGKIAGALIYPAIIFVVLVIVMTIMIVFMVPQVKELYESLGSDELPVVTEILVSIGTTIGKPVNLIIIFILLGGVFGSFRFYISNANGRLGYDKFKLRIPVFGNLSRKIQLVQFTRVTAMLIKSGVPIIETLEIVSRSMGNTVYSGVLKKAVEDIKKGSTLSVALAKNNISEAYPDILIKIISTGEESGKIEKVLSDMAEFYEAEVEQITANLTKLLEPFILVVVGGLVAFLAVAIYLPIYQVGNLF